LEFVTVVTQLSPEVHDVAVDVVDGFHLGGLLGKEDGE
jgi:hypothetical protein